MTTKVYNGDEVFILYGAIPIISGRADDEFCTIEQESDDAVDVVGTDGEVAVSRTNDKRATITVKLLQTSKENDLLSAVRNLFVSAPGGVGGFWPIVVADLRNGRSLYMGANSWINKPPSVSFGRSATMRDWSFRVGHLTRHDGGNTEVSEGSASTTFSTRVAGETSIR